MFFKNKMQRIVVYLAATVLIAYGIGTMMFMVSTKGDFKTTITSGTTVSVDQDKQESLNSAKEIYVEASSASINIIPENRKDVRAHLTGSITSTSQTNQPTLETSVEGNKLNIKVKTQNNSVGITLYRNMSLRLDVYIPAEYADDLMIKSSSGNINISDVKLNNLNCSLSSGKLTLGKISANTFNYDSSSGSLNADELITKSSYLEISSGKITIDKFEGDLKAHSSSGDIKVKYSEFNNNVDITISSGKIDLSLPENSEFKLTAKASSGNVSCEFPISITEKQKGNYLEGVVKSDKNKIVLSSSSGDISVLK